jgi:hypothetical protein
MSQFYRSLEERKMLHATMKQHRLYTVVLLLVGCMFVSDTIWEWFGSFAICIGMIWAFNQATNELFLMLMEEREDRKG